MSVSEVGNNPIGPHRGGPDAQENQNNLDERIYLLVVIGKILQGAAIVGAITLGVCALVVSPSYLFVELLPMFLWALGKEFEEYGMAPAQNGERPRQNRLEAHRNLPPPAQRIPGQPIGFLNPHGAHRCCTNSVAQVALISRGINAILDKSPSKLLAAIRLHYREADTSGQGVASAVNTRQLVKTEHAPDAGSALASLLASLGAEIPALILTPLHSPKEINLQDEQTKQNAFCELMLRPYFENVGHKLDVSPEELFVQIARTTTVKGRHPPLPIPLRFDLSQDHVTHEIPEGGAHFEVDAFIVHTNHAGQGHYVSYKRTPNKEVGGYRWWIINDYRVRPQTEDQVEQALKEACIVHFTRADLAD